MRSQLDHGRLPKRCILEISTCSKGDLGDQYQDYADQAEYEAGDVTATMPKDAVAAFVEYSGGMGEDEGVNRLVANYPKHL